MTSQLVLCGACRKAGLAQEEPSVLWDCSQHSQQREMSPVGGIREQKGGLWGMLRAMLVERGSAGAGDSVTHPTLSKPAWGQAAVTVTMSWGG